MPETPRDKAEQGWVSGRVRESADGLSRREPDARNEARLREAAERERKAAVRASRATGRRF